MKSVCRFFICSSLLLLSVARPASKAKSWFQFQPTAEPSTPPPAGNEAVSQNLYLPLIVSPSQGLPRINAPYFPDEVKLAQAALAWFGRVTPLENYADIRLGYTAQEIKIGVQVFDRLLWYDRSPDASDFTSWDSVSLYLQTGSGSGGMGPDSYRFDAQLIWWGERTNHQLAYQGNGSGWSPSSTAFSTISDWRGNAPNDLVEDRGWKVTYTIPFSSLGLTGAPTGAAGWKIAMVLHDRDDAAASPGPDQSWPRSMDPDQPDTWATLSFGLPAFQSPNQTPSGETLIRNQLNGVTVPDGMVGGSSVCGAKLEYWTQWGNTNYAGAEQVNVQNEADVSDWPCFSKYYLTFPLDPVPSNKTIVSATLTLYQSGNAGGGQWGPAIDSLIQVFTVSEHWDETSLNWNNAPHAAENVSQAWVKPVTDWPGKPGVAWSWDVGRALTEAYEAGRPLSLVLYSADLGYNGGKYFYSSDVGDWNEAGRPTLTVRWADR
jgi:hypothetical protein